MSLFNGCPPIMADREMSDTTQEITQRVCQLCGAIKTRGYNEVALKRAKNCLGVGRKVAQRARFGRNGG
ncbi:hypothetical protein A1OO_21790 [Enterovibrio norvegicus FF-33]|nr:hypothetical protein A1OO_21790 [Enterovibrio norvegicus FF-33]